MLDFKTDLFILRDQNYGDYDRILNVFCKDFGKRAVKLRGAHKFLSKLNSHLQYFSVAECDIVSGKKFDYVCNVSSKKFYKNLLSNPKKEIVYFFVLEVLDKYMDYNLEQNDVYNLCIRYFNFLDTLKLDSCEKILDFKKDKALIQSLYKWFLYFLKLNGLNIKKEFLYKKIVITKKDFFNFVYFYIEKNLKVEVFFI